MGKIKVQSIMEQDNGEKNVAIFEGDAAIILVARDNGKGIEVNALTGGVFNSKIVNSLTETSAEAIAKLMLAVMLGQEVK